PLRSVADPFPTFDGLALDTENDRVIMSDENRHSILVYDRTAGDLSSDPTEPVQFIFGPKSQLGYIAGVEVDPKRKEFYTVNNDSGDRMTVFSYGAHGNVQPKRILTLPHQSWDVSLAPGRDEIAVSIQQSNAISIFRRDATGRDAPIRTIRGLATELHDPHGLYFDETHNEIITANHGNWTQIRPYSPYDPLTTDVGEYKAGAFHPSSITFHAADGDGHRQREAQADREERAGEHADVRLHQRVGGRVRFEARCSARAQLSERAEDLGVCQAGKGNVAPTRVIEGQATNLSRTMHGIAYDD